VRFVCASQVPLATLVERGTFRADLRARLEGVTLHLPPLRERRGDVPALLGRMLTDAAKQRSAVGHPTSSLPRLEPRLVERLCLYDWPLNVRELALVAQRLLVLHGEQATLRLTDLEGILPETARSAPAPVESPQRRDPRAPTASEISELLAALERHDGVVSRAAEELGITRQKAYRLLEISKNKAR
jgi:DNA-binding NtrC family response regulator